MLLSPSEQRCPDSPCTSGSRKSSFDARTRAVRGIAAFARVALASLTLGACSFGGDDGGKLEDGLKMPMARIYGPISSVHCSKSDAAHVPGGGAAYECTLNLANGGKQVICAGLIKGVPAIDRSPCRAGSFPH
jgi:hypothetical protein